MQSQQPTPHLTAAPTQGNQHSSVKPHVVSSKALLQGQTSVLIEHDGQHYQLRATKLGKLILTK